MPTVTIPAFTSPSLTDVRSAEQSIVAAVGGVHEGTLYPGDLDGTNVNSGAGFRAQQMAESRARVCLGLGCGRPGTDVSAAEPPDRAQFVAIEEVELDTITLWHNNSAALTGEIEVKVNGVAVGTLTVDSAGLAAGAFAEFMFPRTLQRGALLELVWRDGTDKLKTLASAAPDTYTVLYAQAWGVARHRA
ncbi:MAG: hypothetical protein ACM3UX_00595 [Candidatus Woesearchaeota archaeon]